MAAAFKLKWNDDSGQYLIMANYSGSGDSAIQFSSSPNEHQDRSRTVYFSAGSVTKSLLVKQEGKRELCVEKDGNVFCDMDGNDFLVVK